MDCQKESGSEWAARIRAPTCPGDAVRHKCRPASLGGRRAPVRGASARNPPMSTKPLRHRRRNEARRRPRRRSGRASAAERLARAGLNTIVFDEKLAWEKPCGGGLTYKAYSHIRF